MRQTFEMWYDVVRKYKLSGDSKVLIWPSHTPKFRPGVLDKTFEKWRDKRITAMCTLMDKQYFKSSREIKNEFGLENADLFRYLQVRHYYDAEI